MSKLIAARDEYGFQNVWTFEGKILYKENDTDDTDITSNVFATGV